MEMFLGYMGLIEIRRVLDNRYKVVFYLGMIKSIKAEVQALLEDFLQSKILRF